MKKNLLGFLSILTVLAVIVSLSYTTTSCSKDDDETETPTTQDTVKMQVSATEVDNSAQGQLAIDEATTAVLGNITSGKGGKGSCPAVSYDTTGSETTVTFNYGTTTCTAASGVQFSGKVIATVEFIRPFTYNSLGSGKTIKLKFESFVVNSQKIEGEITLSVLGNYLLNKEIEFSDELKNVKVTTNGKEYIFNGTQTLIWNYGKSTTFGDYTDDVFTFEKGNKMSGTMPEVGAYTSEVTEDVVMKWCTDRFERTSGTEVITATAYPSVSIAYGAGTCDGKAMATITVKYTVGDNVFENDITQEIAF